MTLKLMLISPNGTVFQDGKALVSVLDDLAQMIRRLDARGVQVALWSNRQSTIDGRPTHEFLSERSGIRVMHFHANQGQLLARQKGGSVAPILAQLGAQRHETLLVGNGQTDLEAGTNNRLLLVRPTWYATDLQYGFPVSSIGGLAKFCELFALRQHPIYWSVDTGDLQVRAMGPFSTLRPDFATFGADAREAAKNDGGEPRFWFLAVVSSLYFSGIIHQVDYICSYPGHGLVSTRMVRQRMDAVLSILGKCFRKTYLPDLIVRHSAAVKSQGASAAQKTFRNQVNTIHLNQKPRSYDKPPRKTALSLRGKTVLVVDDICTNGRSLDAARAYIQAAGGRAILFSWLKTINTDFLHMQPDPQLKPFTANALTAEPGHVAYSYRGGIVDYDAPSEIDERLAAFKAWQWPPR